MKLLHSILLPLTLVALSVSGTAIAAPMSFNFFYNNTIVDGDPILVSGSFTGEDVNGNGYLSRSSSSGGPFGFDEISAFELLIQYRGETVVSTGLDNLDNLNYKIDSDFIGDDSLLLSNTPPTYYGELMNVNFTGPCCQLYASTYVGNGVAGPGTNVYLSSGITGFVNDTRPDLISVSAVPLPAAVWLFGSALLGMMVVSRSRSGV